MDPTYVEELSQSMRRLGVLVPISVRWDEAASCYRIIAGECRFTAAKRAELREIPCWVKQPGDEEVLLEQIVENWHRSDLNPFELADAVAILRDANELTYEQLAQSTGKSKGEISKLLTILDLDADVQKIAREDTSGRIGKRHLYSLARLPALEQKDFLRRIRRERLSADALDRLVAQRNRKNDVPGKAGAPVTRRRFATKCGTVLFTYRKKDVTDTDLLMTLREVRAQIIDNSNDPTDME